MQRIAAKNLSKKFRIGFRPNKRFVPLNLAAYISGKESKKDYWALRNITFFANAGDIIGILGDNGAGKTTLLSIFAGIYQKDSGVLTTTGKIISILGLGGGLKDKLTMRDNTYLFCSLFGLEKQAIKNKFSAIVKFAGLENYIDTKLYQFSSGMKGRLIFSIAVHSDPDILLLDEVTANADKNFMKKSADKLKELAAHGATVLLTSHDLWIIEHCHKAVWLKNGKIVMQGSSKDIIKNYKENESTTSVI